MAGGGRRARRGALRLLLVMGPALVGGVSLAGAGAAGRRAAGRAPRPRRLIHEIIRCGVKFFKIIYVTHQVDI